MDRATRLAEIKAFLLWTLLFIGVVARQGALVLFAAALLAFDYVASRWTKWNMASLTYRQRLSRRQVWPGETIILTFEIENRGFVPVSLLETYVEISDVLGVSGGIFKTVSSLSGTFIHNVFRLRFWERLRRHYRIICPRRGKYLFGPTEVVVTDPFGFVTNRKAITETTSLLVYPKLYDLEELDIRPRALMGDWGIKSFIHEDPLRFVGTREYRPGDPLNRINWKATAKAGQHMVHVYEPSANLNVQFILNLTTNEPAWHGIDHEEAEWAISVTASLGLAALNAGLSVGVLASDYDTNLPVGSGEEQVANLLETLAATSTFSLWRSHMFLEHALENRTFGTTLVFVTPRLGAEVSAAILEAQARGVPLKVVYTSSKPAELQADCGMLWIRKGDEYAQQSDSKGVA